MGLVLAIQLVLGMGLFSPSGRINPHLLTKSQVIDIAGKMRFWRVWDWVSLGWVCLALGEQVSNRFNNNF
jgi:hypothetical protein